MCCESLYVVRFDLGPLLQGQTRIAKLLITRLLLVLEVCNVKPTCRILWAGNLLALVSCLSGGYRFALVLRCVGLVLFISGNH